MKMVNTDADWSKEVSDAGDKVMCSTWSCGHGEHTPPARPPSVASQPTRCCYCCCCAAAACVAVIDVYTSSWGPSEMIAGHCQSWYFDLGEKFGIKFVRAQSDNISALKDYKGRAQSAFVFYLVSVLLRARDLGAFVELTFVRCSWLARPAERREKKGARGPRHTGDPQNDQGGGAQSGRLDVDVEPRSHGAPPCAVCADAQVLAPRALRGQQRSARDLSSRATRHSVTRALTPLSCSFSVRRSACTRSCPSCE
jgi:hypothetical protein